MDPKIKKGLRLAAAAIFVFALALNIKITLDGPFMMMSDKAVASTTYNSSSDGTGCNLSGFYIHYPQKDNTGYTSHADLVPSSPTSTQATAVNGKLTLGTNTVSVGGGACSSATFTTTIVHWTCDHDFWSYPSTMKCYQKDTQSIYSYTSVN